MNSWGWQRRFRRSVEVTLPWQQPGNQRQDRPSPGATQLVARGLALFFGGFALLNILGGLRAAHFDANLWWIDLRALPPVITKPFLLLASGCLLGFAVWPPRSSW